ncbi:MAG: hemolysin family protein [Parvibaculales bacterium]
MSKHDEVATIGLWERIKTWLGLQDSNLRESLEDVLDEESQSDTSLRNEELHMLRNLLGFKDVRVDDVMVPRADIVAVDATLDYTELTEKFIGCAHSRLPIYNETLDDPVGMVHIKDVLAYRPNNKSDKPLIRLRRDVLYAPPSMPALDLLLRMQTTRTHMALVVDEFGGTDGLVTIEDLVEEIVGEIEDEHDGVETLQLIERRKGVFDAHARLPIEDLEEKLVVHFVAEDEDIDTLGGLVFSLAGHVPQRGEVIPHESGIEFEVRDADARRIKWVRIRMPISETEQG